VHHVLELADASAPVPREKDGGVVTASPWDGLRALAEAAATPGPWHATGLNGPDDTVITDEDDPVCHALPRDTRFIAAANPHTILALIDDRDRLRNALRAIGGLS
jgi:hypothetical protein